MKPSKKEMLGYARTLIEASLDPLVTIGPKGKITDANKATIKATGVHRKKLIGTKFSDYFTEPKKARVGYKKVLKEGFVKDYPLTLKHKSGKLMDVLYNATVYKDEKGNIIGIFAAARDITKRKEIENMKIDFLNTTSHELKTPLTPVRSYLDLLQDGSLGKLNNQQRQALKIIDKNIRNLKRLIDDILDLTKIEVGKMKLFMEKIRLDNLVKENINNLKHLAKERNIKLAALLSKKLPLTEGDRQRLLQVLENLIDNAIKFSPKNTKITIAAKKQNHNILVSVKDQGIGISKKNIKNLFTKFFQVDTSATREHPGTGLGLVVCKGIIEAHNGKIWAKSKLGKGSTFYFTLPIKQTKNNQKAKYKKK